MIDYMYFVIRKYDLPDETMKNSICDLLVRGDIMREKKSLNLKNSLNENSISSTCTYYNMTENYSRNGFLLYYFMYPINSTNHERSQKYIAYSYRNG